MAAEKDPPTLKSTGFLQQHRGDKGQYVYWMTMPHPKPEAVAAHGMKVPEEFTRPEFNDLGVEVHTTCKAPFTGAWRCSFTVVGIGKPRQHGGFVCRVLQQDVPVARHSLSHRLRWDRRGAGPC